MDLKIGEAPGVRPTSVQIRPMHRIIFRLRPANQQRLSFTNSATRSTPGSRSGTRTSSSERLEFKKYRLKGQEPVELNTLFSQFDPGERGADDDFGKLFGHKSSSAYYTGKDYGDHATEILSMGMEQLYKNPAHFARTDPEFCKFVLGILDGSLR